MSTYQVKSQVRSILLRYQNLSESGKAQADKLLIVLFYRLTATLAHLYQYKGKIDGKDIVELDNSVENLKNLYTIVKGN